LFLIGVPATMPLPRLLARCLCLCSGLPPVIGGGHAWAGSSAVSTRYYRRVPPQIAELVANKLDQQLDFCDLSDAVAGIDHE
jgi:hypothetical protein